MSSPYSGFAMGASSRIPPLEPGDRLTRDEFERRYQAMPRLKKAEPIEGIVFLSSTCKFRAHAQPHFDLVGWLGIYEAFTPGVEGGSSCTVRLDLDNEPQPDALLLIDPALGGQVRISDDDYIEAAPELVAEVAASSASYDLHTKLHVYRRNGVREYLVGRALDQQIDWFALHGSQFELLPKDAEEILRSEVFPGLWLDAAALLQGNITRVQAVLQRGLASAEHGAFVQKLQV